MAKKVVAINASPRTTWNTAQLVREAAQGAADAGAEIEVIDLYRLDPFMGCRSCFACKTEQHYGKCVYPDSLAETLDKLHAADGIILGSPNYFGRPSSGYRALHERLCFQYLTYRVEAPCCNERPVPVLFLMTSNCPEEMYEQNGYNKMIAEYAGTLGNFVGPTTTFVAYDTLQTNHYDEFNWTMFNVEAKQRRHEEVFPQDLAQVRTLAAKLFA